ncbi:hypothetical protein WQ53_10300 [Pseudoxanthomonas suwonensis]|uniref:Glycine zipper domain-containing protein n=1 Tax=Pseudoxanthomonas suwonensis TaxID=314722 RepID=A0A0E3Z255_9GAMM|nr:hypothetical protein WQ53_10300 [Pseudoxanthomonas suwonensis]
MRSCTVDNTKKNETRDLNRDPLTGAPGSHPVGVGVGGVGGAAAGVVIGALGGPLGMLIGGGIGTLVGAAAGKGVAERIDPTGEEVFWRQTHASRPYHDARFDYENDYAPAYSYGVDARARMADRVWDDRLEHELGAGWGQVRGQSKLEWDHARDAVRDAWDRSDRTYRAYDASDRYYADQFERVDYREADAGFDDYRPAYRYGTQARSRYGDREWDDHLESELGQGWDQAKGNSRLGWEQAKAATRDAWHNVERALPGDADGDGR